MDIRGYEKSMGHSGYRTFEERVALHFLMELTRMYGREMDGGGSPFTVGDVRKAIRMAQVWAEGVEVMKGEQGKEGL